ncbi:hypothetical protein CYLTODRAFT_236098 [Cylindrobasidium torrendii FP15055 ss-10]|uniref:Zn(2)-C6 fungal-type domain-containing protein n=1 Tax=Cylindrobasidium torrendii FP15055 ss-10 TaxID=1314674 RepID=A0A0D7BGK6_9AGAR|nr:hypothetical protein CYLTODRAFT_236098 [Cylindrobasidium torrendii FP15055 ss-10]
MFASVPGLQAGCDPLACAWEGCWYTADKTLELLEHSQHCAYRPNGWDQPGYGPGHPTHGYSAQRGAEEPSSRCDASGSGSISSAFATPPDSDGGYAPSPASSLPVRRVTWQNDEEDDRPAHVMSTSGSTARPTGMEEWGQVPAGSSSPSSTTASSPFVPLSPPESTAIQFRVYDPREESSKPSSSKSYSDDESRDEDSPELFSSASASLINGPASTSRPPLPPTSYYSAPLYPDVEDAHVPYKSASATASPSSEDNHPARRKIACLPCRIQKRKCDAVRPVCGHCDTAMRAPRKPGVPELQCVYDTRRSQSRDLEDTPISQKPKSHRTNACLSCRKLRNKCDGVHPVCGHCVTLLHDPSAASQQCVYHERVSNPCNRCRTQKTKCDGVKPSCERCMHNGYKCEYRDSSKGAARKGVPEPYVNSTRGFACVSCRQSKRVRDSVYIVRYADNASQKCGGELPTCARCNERHKICVYPARQAYTPGETTRDMDVGA